MKHVNAVAFQGYDMDQDGWITKEDLRKMYRAYFDLSMEIVRDAVKDIEREIWDEFDDKANKPVSAAFTAPIPETATPSNDSASAPGPSSSSAPRKSEGTESSSAPTTASIVVGEMSTVTTTASSSQPTSATSPSRLTRLRLTSPSRAIQASLASPVAGGSLLPSPLQLNSPMALNFHSAHLHGNGTTFSSPQDPHAPSVTVNGHSTSAVEYDPVMERMSQEAIEELVERTFVAIQHVDPERIAFDEFAAFSQTDQSLLSWLDALGTVF